MLVFLSFVVAIGMAFLFPVAEIAELPKETIMLFVAGKVFLLNITLYAVSLTLAFLAVALVMLKRSMKIQLSRLYINSLIAVNFSYAAYVVVDYMSRKGYFYFESFAIPLLAAILVNFYWNRDIYMRTMHIEIPDEVKTSVNKIACFSVYSVWFVAVVCLHFFF